MSKLVEAYREIGVYNPHSFAGHGNVFIHYSPNEVGRISRPAVWRVYRVGFKTDPGAFWMDNGSKAFQLYRYDGTHAERKIACLEEAKTWASERYGITEWARTPFGSWMDAAFVKERMLELKIEIQSKAG